MSYQDQEMQLQWHAHDTERATACHEARHSSPWTLFQASCRLTAAWPARAPLMLSATVSVEACAIMQNEAKFYLIEDTPKFTKFMREPIRAQPGSAPLDTPGYFVAGIVKGYLESAGFQAECAPTIQQHLFLSVCACLSLKLSGLQCLLVCRGDQPCLAWGYMLAIPSV
jgi:Transport protein particle (TRAPP) component